MKQSKLIVFFSLQILFVFTRITFIKAQQPTSPPLPTSTPITISLAPSVTLGKKPPQALGKKPSKQDIAKKVALHANDMITRANNALTRLDAIWARVMSRIEKFKAAGKDVSGLSGWIQQVEFKRKIASDTIASASANVTKIENTPSPKNAVKSFVGNFRTIKKALKDYHQAMLTVIRNIKGMSANTGVGPSVIPSATKVPTPTISGAATPSATIIPPSVTIGPT